MKNYVAIPNELIQDSNLRPSTKRVAFALYAYRGKANSLCRTVASLARQCHCCQNTVRQALSELEERNYIQRKHRYRYDPILRRPVFVANRYMLRVDMSRGYTLIPRDTLHAQVTHAQFAILLLLMCYQGRKNHAYPSTRKVANDLWMATSTVCVAILVLVKCQHVVRNRCLTQIGCYSCNSYYIVFLVGSIDGGCPGTTAIVPQPRQFGKVGGCSDF